MKKRSVRVRKCLTIIALYGLTSCAENKIKTQQQLDLNQVKRIELHIDALDQTALPEEVKQQVTSNLLDWDYPIGAKDGLAFSHTLKATVGNVEHGNTPTGFSFSSGNSDPRAMEFQKADVLPISCELTSIAHSEQSSALTMGFTASQTDPRSLSTDKLVDHISTVCFTLLHELKWPEKPEQTSVPPRKTSWIPEIRIESQSAPAPETNNPDNQAFKAEQPKKDLIIHNQGSPVILHWGHERK